MQTDCNGTYIIDLIICLTRFLDTYDTFSSKVDPNYFKIVSMTKENINSSITSFYKLFTVTMIFAL